MKIAIGCDPNAQEAKEQLITFMESKGYGEITDFGSEDQSTPIPLSQLQRQLPLRNMTVEFCCAEQASAYLSRPIK